MDWPSLSYLAPWHWWILGAALLILEVLTPGIFFVWLALAALVLGLIEVLLPLSVPLQLVLYAVLCVGSVWLGRRFLARLPRSAEADTLGQGAARLVGKRVVLTEAIQGGEGRARIGDGTWAVRGPDAPAGSRVVIVAAQGAVLTVQQLTEGSEPSYPAQRS
ncbi:NfeD family protein (plasmid) [Deinococcus sp. KNUC1210]|uniref:NfeD family protein n=1 Tax=Deinococcus sp. KNUC1210 TaxID=2917691 RepID=UPI001EF038A6|nr:NfeD family protein [Deinococcus sp. KNUC1210]ULH17095.1 NfeD family protein [Deinococcus sp. KNUC1210]